jgi:hypothetical protein
LEEKLKEQLGDNWEEQLSGNFYTNRALIHYYAMLETHRAGRAYQQMIENMYFVNSDFDDCIYHFNIASERFIIYNAENEKYGKNITRGIDQRTKILKKRYKGSSLYDANNYFDPHLT